MTQFSSLPRAKHPADLVRRYSTVTLTYLHYCVLHLRSQLNPSASPSHRHNQTFAYVPTFLEKDLRITETSAQLMCIFHFPEPRVMSPNYLFLSNQQSKT